MILILNLDQYLNLSRDVKKNLAMTSCRQIMTSLSFFQFMVNLEQSGRCIPNPWSVKLTFSLKVNFYLTKTENGTKRL